MDLMDYNDDMEKKTEDYDGMEMMIETWGTMDPGNMPALQSRMS